MKHPARGSCIAWLMAAVSLLGVRALAGDLEEGVFRIVYPDAHESLARESLSILREALAAFSPALPSGEAPIQVVICNTHPGFARYAGGLAPISVTGVALPEDGVIAVKTPNLVPGGVDYRGTLRHELVHVLLARNTDADNLPRWLNEGIAMMMSGEHRWGSGTRVAEMYVQGRLIGYRDLFFVFFQPGKEMEFGDAYAQALSMTRFLQEEVGEERFWRIVRATKSQDFGKALRAEASMSPMAFYDAWVASMWKVALIFSLVSGFSLFQIMAILTVIGYLRKRRQGQETMRAWEDDENEDDGNAEDETHESAEWEEEDDQFLREDEE